MPRRVIAYIDGFNLFYSCLKGTKHKWLDLVGLVQSLMKTTDELIAVKYFTANVIPFGDDRERQLAQMMYLNALKTNPKIVIKLGKFSIHTTKMPLAKDWNEGKINLVDVIKTEEKGTDVNLAVQMVADAKDDLFDYAMLFSNDSDMTEAIRIATKDCGKTVGLFIDKKAISFPSLKQDVLHIKRLTPSMFANHQLPDVIKTEKGRIITKPVTW